MFFLAGPCGVGVGWAGAHAGACAAKQAEASRLGGDEAGHSASASWALGEGEGLLLWGLTGQGLPCSSYLVLVGCMCWVLSQEEPVLGFGKGLGWGLCFQNSS